MMRKGMCQICKKKHFSMKTLSTGLLLFLIIKVLVCLEIKLKIDVELILTLLQSENASKKISQFQQLI